MAILPYSSKEQEVHFQKADIQAQKLSRNQHFHSTLEMGIKTS